jgi:hypothetical protein
MTKLAVFKTQPGDISVSSCKLHKYEIIKHTRPFFAHWPLIV